MSNRIKTELACFTLIGSILTCTHGLNLDFSRLSFYKNPFLHKRGEQQSACYTNPCAPSKPFLCKSTGQCVELKYVCDGTRDCDDGFDELPAVCNAAQRPSKDALYDFVENERSWMIPKLFNGASPELVAHALSVATDMNDLRDQIGMTDENVDNLRQAFEGIYQGDPRALLKMGMSDRSWNEVQYVLQSLLDSGFKVLD